MCSYLIKKEKIIESGDYNLSADRYKRAIVYNSEWDFVEIKDICELVQESY